MNKKRLVTVVALVCLSSNAVSADILWRTPDDKTKTKLMNLFVEKTSLKDPGSVQFRNLKVDSKDNKKNNESSLYCGEFNAKNSYGAYVGFKRFLALDRKNEESFVSLEPSQHNGMFLVLFGEICKDTGLPIN